MRGVSLWLLTMVAIAAFWGCSPAGAPVPQTDQPPTFVRQDMDCPQLEMTIESFTTRWNDATALAHVVYGQKDGLHDYVELWLFYYQDETVAGQHFAQDRQRIEQEWTRHQTHGVPAGQQLLVRRDSPTEYGFVSGRPDEGWVTRYSMHVAGHYAAFFFVAASAEWNGLPAEELAVAPIECVYRIIETKERTSEGRRVPTA